MIHLNGIVTLAHMSGVRSKRVVTTALTKNFQPLGPE